MYEYLLCKHVHRKYGLCVAMRVINLMANGSRRRCAELGLSTCCFVMFSTILQSNARLISPINLYIFRSVLILKAFVTLLSSFANFMTLSFLSFQFNFVGRILGPRGMTAKQLEQETGCKIMVRGKGSMRDKKKVNNIGN